MFAQLAEFPFLCAIPAAHPAAVLTDSKKTELPKIKFDPSLFFNECRGCVTSSGFKIMCDVPETCLAFIAPTDADELLISVTQLRHEVEGRGIIPLACSGASLVVVINPRSVEAVPYLFSFADKGQLMYSLAADNASYIIRQALSVFNDGKSVDASNWSAVLPNKRTADGLLRLIGNQIGSDMNQIVGDSVGLWERPRALV